MNEYYKYENIFFVQYNEWLEILISYSNNTNGKILERNFFLFVSSAQLLEIAYILINQLNNFLTNYFLSLSS